MLLPEPDGPARTSGRRYPIPVPESDCWGWRKCSFLDTKSVVTFVGECMDVCVCTYVCVFVCVCVST